ncbi:MptD family putative ECF transporter S component [Sporomusa sphaeroides DSM 2875]|uniref:MptD family putative ECF transporter S component n=1 Tax=Sporomusa sphaeroides TaxID=47679 RepID=UPI0020309241|nr:MptD family putative ECF transporter S component [Sporomusa sphaeroides]MCM0760878.1 MptD family putative ECF transporter S component [Sporomusa sphaeroides DSM 2875]
MNIQSSSKMQVKDFITLGVLNAVFTVLFILLTVVVGIFPVTGIFAPAIAAIPLGVVFMLLMIKVAKKGTLLVSGVLQAVILFLLSGSWTFVVAIILATLLGELIVWGSYKDLHRVTISYAVLICGYALGSFAPIVFFTESWRTASVASGYNASYVNAFTEILNGPILLGVLVASALGALLGAILGKKMLKKHFVKAGVIS